MAQISVGGIIRGDTLVSTSREFSPPEYFDYSSIIDPRSAAFEGAISQQDLVIWATDTITEGTESDYFYPRRHQPLFVKLTNSSYSWSYEYAEDFILFQLDVHNIGRNRIDSAYVAILTIPAVGHFGRQFLSDDDLGGFRSVVTTPGPCEFEDTLNVMWWADNDGDPINGVFTDKVTHDDSTGWYFRSCPFGFAIYILSPPAVPGRNDWRKATLSYNWWNYSPIPSHDFGPRRLRDYRDFGTGRTGTP
ncbi:MAG TPA: hypothetical protein VN285_06265 [Candidatus Deferrimicrobium sp.]|nr:hypothetical protein [Candidatus Deferrimicrobium sp.]